MYSVAPTDVSSLFLRDPTPLCEFSPLFKLSIHRRKKCTFLPMCPSCDSRRGGVGRMDGTWRTMQPPPARVGVRTSHQSALEPGGLEILDPGPPNHLIHWPLYRHAANKEEEVRSNYTRGEKEEYYRRRIHERTISLRFC